MCFCDEDCPCFQPVGKQVTGRRNAAEIFSKCSCEGSTPEPDDCDDDCEDKGVVLNTWDT